MNRIRQKIETILYGNEKTQLLSVAALLSVISLGYTGVIKTRNLFYRLGLFRSKKLPCRVISIGNLCVGGTGKTPMTIYTAKMLKDMGYTVSIVSRGYKGRAEKTGGIVSNGRNITMDPDTAGDEPYMIARSINDIPVIVGKNRYEAGMTATNRFQSDVIVLDDAFQHRKLFRDIDLVLLDYKEPFGNSRLLPRGRLREPMSALSRSTGIVLTRSEVVPDGKKKDPLARAAVFLKEQPVFSSRHVPYLYAVVKSGCPEPGRPSPYPDTGSFEGIKGKNVFAFSGIAGNDDFKKTIERLQCRVIDFIGFPDHHRYSNQDLEGLFRSAKDANVDYVITTEKDYVRMYRDVSWPVDLAVIGIKISLGEDKAAFKRFLTSRL